MAKDLPPSVSIILQAHRDKRGVYAQAVTWGIKNGTYGSLGSVRIPLEAVAIPKDGAELARLLLTALYGGPYDL